MGKAVRGVFETTYLFWNNRTLANGVSLWLNIVKLPLGRMVILFEVLRKRVGTFSRTGKLVHARETTRGC